MVQLPFRVPQLGPRTRKVVRYVGLAFFALVVFVFALQMTFPYKRVKDKLVEALSEKYEVTIGSVDRGFMPGRVYFKAVTLRTRPSKPEEVVTTFFIKQLELDAGVLSLLGGTISMDMEAQIGAGTLEGAIAVAKFGRGDIDVHFVGTALPGDLLPMRAVLGLPMTGKIAFSVNLDLPVEKSKMGKTSVNWKRVTGAITLGCPTGCTFGDGKTKLKPLLKNTRNQVMVGEGIDFGQVNLDSLAARATFKGGKLTLDKFDTKSKDGELKVELAMTLEKEFSQSQVTGCLRFKGSDDLLKREPKTYAAIQTTGAELRGDGLFHITLSGEFDKMKRLNRECGPNAGDDDENDRPELSIQPADTVRPGSAAATAPPPPPPAPTPMDSVATPQDAGTTTAPTPSPTPPPPAATFTDGVPPGGGSANPMNTEPPRERPGEQGSAARGGAPGQEFNQDTGGSAAPAQPPPE